MKTLLIPTIDVLRAVKAMINGGAKSEGVNVVRWSDRTTSASMQSADIVTSVGHNGLHLEAFTELGELYIEIVLAPLVTKAAS